MGLLTTTAGWFPKPATLRRARWQLAEGEIEAPALRKVELDATRAALQLQEKIGIDLPTDGQMDRGDMVTSFAERLDGVEEGGLVRCFGNRYYRKPRVVGEIARGGPITLENWKAATEMASGPVKAILTGPYTLMDWSFDESYGSREKCCLAFAGAVRAEAIDLAAAGAKEIEIDEPAISARPDEMDLAAQALGQVTEPLQGKARTWTHLAYGDFVPVIDRILNLPVDGILLEMANSDYELLEAIGDLPEGKLFGAGVVDVLSAEVESAATVRGRVERLLEKLPADRLWLLPDAGLRTLTDETARAKLEVLVEAAAALR